MNCGWLLLLTAAFWKPLDFFVWNNVLHFVRIQFVNQATQSRATDYSQHRFDPGPLPKQTGYLLQLLVFHLLFVRIRPEKLK